MDHEPEQAPGHVGQPADQPAPVPATEPKPDTNLNPVSRAPNLRFPVPAFYTDDPDLWFFQLEASFIVNRVNTEKDKYAVVVANLPYSVARCIPGNLVMETMPYTILNELVVKETDLSDYQRCEKLHALPALGDQRPSELLTSFCNLQPVQDCGCYCSRYQFLYRMPPITRASGRGGRRPPQRRGPRRPPATLRLCSAPAKGEEEGEAGALLVPPEVGP